MKQTQTDYFGMGLTELRPVPRNVKAAVSVLRAVNHTLRRRIIDMLIESGGMCVTDVYIRLRIEQSIISQHLAILRRAGVVVTERQGKHIYYTVSSDRVDQINRACKSLI